MRVWEPGPRSVAAQAHDARLYLKGSPAQETFLPLTLVSGQGEYVRDADGREYVDCAAGLLVPCGHAFEPVRRAVAEAAGQLEACEDYANPHRAALGELLEEIVPGPPGGIQYFSSGTEAVEAGLRLMRVISGRESFVSFRGSYHGKTLGGAALAGSTAGIEAEPPRFAQVEFCFPRRGEDVRPCVTDSLEGLRRTLEEMAGRTAGVVIESIQGGAGIRRPPRAFLEGVQDLCRAHDVLLMVDEVFMGMGRSGTFLAYEQFGLDPDVVAIGKGLGNGTPISAVLVHSRHADRTRRLEGGTTYGGNPVSCAAAVQTLRSLFEQRLPERAAAVGEALAAELDPLADLDGVADVRTAGCVAAIEFGDSGRGEGTGAARARTAYELCCRDRVLTTPRGAILRLAPPLTISDSARELATTVACEAVAAACA